MSAPAGTPAGQGTEVREAGPQDEAAILELLHGAFGRWPRGLQVSGEEFYRWKHRESPFGPSLALVAHREGELAGYAAYMPWRFTGPGGVVGSVRGVDFAVAERHRMKGVSMAVRAAAEGKFPSDAAFIWSNPNPASRPGGAKAGRRTVGGVRRWIGAGSPLGAVRARVGARSLSPVPSPSVGVTVDEALRALGGAPAAAGPPGGRMATVRDGGYLHWRYGRFPAYRALACEGGRAEGMVIFRMRTRRRLLIADVCELLVAPGDTRSARALLGMLRREVRCDVIRAAFDSDRSAAACGFARLTDGGALSVFALREGLAPDPAQPGTLVLSRGDLELL